MVYIAEAHAKDIWPLGTLESLPSHEIIQDRLNAAQILLSKYKSKIPMLLDTMSDEFDSEYAIWPERYYVIRAGKIEHVFMPTHEFGFDHEEMYALLQKNFLSSGGTSCNFSGDYYRRNTSRGNFRCFLIFFYSPSVLNDKRNMKFL